MNYCFLQFGNNRICGLNHNFTAVFILWLNWVITRHSVIVKSDSVMRTNSKRSTLKRTWLDVQVHIRVTHLNKIKQIMVTNSVSHSTKSDSNRIWGKRRKISAGWKIQIHQAPGRFFLPGCVPVAWRGRRVECVWVGSAHVAIKINIVRVSQITPLPKYTSAFWDCYNSRTEG